MIADFSKPKKHKQDVSSLKKDLIVINDDWVKHADCHFKFKIYFFTFVTYMNYDFSQLKRNIIPSYKFLM